MINTILKPGWIYKTNAKFQSLMGYSGFKGECLGPTGSTRADASSIEAERELNQLMSGYPRNHEYRIVNKRVVPGFRLYERVRLVTQAYPQPLESFIDVGCCRGFYALDAVQRLGCARAVGIDVYDPFVSTAQKAAEYLGASNASFHFAGVEEVSNEPEKFGGPFQVVLLIGTYHYLFWGSRTCSTAYHSHDEILRRLASICTDRLIFSGRLTMERLPECVKEKLDGTEESQVPYTPEAFLKSAETFFDVRQTGYLGTYPLFVMTKKRS